MIDLSDPAAICRSINYFIEFLVKIGPAALLCVFALWVFKK